MRVEDGLPADRRAAEQELLALVGMDAARLVAAGALPVGQQEVVARAVEVAPLERVEGAMIGRDEGRVAQAGRVEHLEDFDRLRLAGDANAPPAAPGQVGTRGAEPLGGVVEEVLRTALLAGRLEPGGEV